MKWIFDFSFFSQYEEKNIKRHESSGVKSDRGKE